MFLMWRSAYLHIRFKQVKKEPVITGYQILNKRFCSRS